MSVILRFSGPPPFLYSCGRPKPAQDLAFVQNVWAKNQNFFFVCANIVKIVSESTFTGQIKPKYVVLGARWSHSLHKMMLIHTLNPYLWVKLWILRAMSKVLT